MTDCCAGIVNGKGFFSGTFGNHSLDCHVTNDWLDGKILSTVPGDKVIGYGEKPITPFFSDDWMTIYGGDCRTVLAALPEKSVHCVVTSPPYWGLRDYGTATWVGGDKDCDHKPPYDPTFSGLEGGKATQGAAQIYRDLCGKCGAKREDAQLGLEATPDEYVANLVDVFRKVHRVLRDDGTAWLNLGDSYANDTISPPGSAKQSSNRGASAAIGVSKAGSGLRAKNLVGIPWRVAFALQADGWYLRSDVVWSKPNPMPDSVTDRPTKSHEYVFMLTKSPRYYFDNIAVEEKPATTPHIADGDSASLWSRPTDGAKRETRNIRSVWTIVNEPYPGSHFATFPRKLVEPCVKASTSEHGVCATCGAPWKRILEQSNPLAKTAGRHAAQAEANKAKGIGGEHHGGNRLSGDVLFKQEHIGLWRTVGWTRTCRHDGDPVPAVVMDIFGGSGTTALVAQSLSRRAILIDLNPDYLKQMLRRNANLPLGLT